MARKLRKLSPDPLLFRRRAAGEPLRDLARDYGVSHTTLSRYFARPDVAGQLKRADQLNRAEQRAAEARWRAEEKAEREARRKAKRPLRKASPPSPPDEPDDAGLAASTAVRRRASGGRIVRLDRSGSYADWLDERDRRLPAAPDRRVQLVTESGETIASTTESNAERMSAALEPHYGPLTVVPA